MASYAALRTSAGEGPPQLGDDGDAVGAQRGTRSDVDHAEDASRQVEPREGGARRIENEIRQIAALAS